MRCILVNDANLKADTPCAHCRNKIGESYVRDIGDRVFYCGYDCFRRATEVRFLRPGYAAPPANVLPIKSWTVIS
jgi:hypothetical protein